MRNLSIALLRWAFLLSSLSGTSQAQTIRFQGQALDSQSHRALSATWQWADSTGRVLVERTTTTAGFADTVPQQIRFLTVASPSYRTIRLPVRWPVSQPVSFRARIPLVPIDKVTTNQPYFQSEQQPIQVPASQSASARIQVQFFVCDALTNRPVQAEICLFQTRKRQRTCYTTNPSIKTEVSLPDIVAIEVRAAGYQLYQGNMVINDLPQRTNQPHTIRLNPTPTLLMATLPAATPSSVYCLKAIKTGVMYPLTLLDSTYFLGEAPPGSYQLVHESNGTAALSELISLYEGLNGYVGPSIKTPAEGAPPAGVIYFTQSSYEISDSAQRHLDRLIIVMRKHPQLKLRIVGHTDNVGEPHLNLALSEFRAKITRAYFRQRGIGEGRLLIEATGARLPAAANDTEANRRLNRRVTLHFTE